MQRSHHLILMTVCSILFVTISLAQKMPSGEEAYYLISDVPIPDDVVLEVGGLDFDDEERLGVCTRRGEIWLITNPGSDAPEFKRFAHGLHEPLGLGWKDGAFISNQRGELTRISDQNGDLIADQYEPIYSWELAGNYHEYSYGPVFLPNDDMLVTLNLGWVGRGASLSKWHGWMLKISPEGKMTPIATGMRSPAGFGLNAAGDIFYTENQGDWVGSGRMTHIEPGDFVGHPEGLKWSNEPESNINLRMEDIDDSRGLTLFEYAKENSTVKAPSVWFPHTIMGISTSDMVVVPDGFGPFTGQLLVGDQGHSKIMRVYQEKVNGVYQGICFPFREGFSSGVLRMRWSKDKTLYVGMTNRGWASTGKEPYGLERLRWSGKVPFEMQKVNINADGFTITFTQPVDRRSAADPDSYAITDFTYKYHHLYGSPAINTQTRTVYKVEVSQDNLQARLFVEGLRHGYVNEIKVPGVKSTDNRRLLHSTGYYTINEIPGQDMDMAHDDHTSGIQFNEVDIQSPKRVTKMPDEWVDGPDQTVTIGTLPGMQYDTKEFTVKAGSRIKLILNNPDDMMHNLVIVQPGTIDEVAQLAIDLGLKGQEKGYIPESEQVLFHTNLLAPQSSDAIYFKAPDKPGEYGFVCTFPGHALIMRGKITVVPGQ
ncbi:MAG: auracyanin family protein [Saprospiraceae bacterium]|nr:auracyanin family protein [Saprospiraceae bacterium]